MARPGDVPVRPGFPGRPAVRRWPLATLLAAGLALLAGCATTRVVPVAAPGAAVDPAASSVQVSAEGVTLTARGLAWDGSPSYLVDYVTPFHLRLANGTPWPLGYGYADLRLFDDARFQYTALPPAEVEQILRAAARALPPGVSAPLLAAATSPIVASDAGLAARSARRRVAGHTWRPWGPWGPWGPFWWDSPWGWPGPYYVPPAPLDQVLTLALPVGLVQPGAQVEGFVYFPRLRSAARRLTLEFHHRLGDTPRLLGAEFVVDRG